MKKWVLIFCVLMLSIVGCGKQDVAESYINTTFIVKERIEDTFDYKVINEIENKNSAQNIINIFKNVKWETNTERRMATEPDYRMNNYAIWITPNGDRLEIINKDNSNYVRLTQEKSAELFKVMTRNELKSR
ncbi:hypothetical protein E3U55_04460 [Filobacillus milosensis]|uniref:Lipoprotein n=1 Tax=Filobacillus milosensis TaxID=94137 RepID=A0A4Y8IT14_9BACI|nr:hypothetical protein [Filobacillus milosensis]TFB24070.1 hypothetical protein E3U55_04460 [Filobacillus milosensis]